MKSHTIVALFGHCALLGYVAAASFRQLPQMPLPASVMASTIGWDWEGRDSMSSIELKNLTVTANSAHP